MTLEDYTMRKLFVIAQMAATLEAGDKAGDTDDGPNRVCSTDVYAKHAVALFDAVETAMEQQMLRKKSA